MQHPPQRIVLVELPTFPKGTVALSLYAVAAAIPQTYRVDIMDLNHEDWETGLARGHGPVAMVGVKVSAQNFHLGKELSEAIRQGLPQTRIVWGGEYPTLAPDACLPYCDAVVSGPFESVALGLLEDLRTGNLQQQYAGSQEGIVAHLRPARLDLSLHASAGNRFMGLPLETSRGCTYKCTFCMVHTMQPGYQLKSRDQIAAELPAYKGRFLNLVDYNLGVSKAHVISTAQLIGASEVLGWMGEMCLESLDDAEVLSALGASRCRMIYCGLEAVEEAALRSVNKATTNRIANYARIIRMAQAHGVQIAAGAILGLAGASEASLRATRKAFEEMGIAYTKLTFLTYNPGTKVKESMRRVGTYPTEEVGHFDGNHLSYQAEGVEPEALYRATIEYIRRHYSLTGILRRSLRLKLGFWARIEFILFNLCYRAPYRQWVRADVFRRPEAFDALLRAKVRKGWGFRMAESLLERVRRIRYRQDKRKYAHAAASVDFPAPLELSVPT